MQDKLKEPVRVHPTFAKALEDLLAAGACERAAIINPDNARTWRAVAAAKRKDAQRALNEWVKRAGQ